MHILALLLGGFAASQFTGYPSEINNMKGQIPKADRDAIMGQYKHLPGDAKTSFKQALRDADVAAASKILGQDLSKYNLVLKKAATAAETSQAQTPVVSSGTDIIERVNKILAVPTGIDPELVAEAARRYEEAVPRGSSLSITEKTKKLIELSG